MNTRDTVIEPISPFLNLSRELIEPISRELVTREKHQSLLYDLLCSPEALAERLMKDDRRALMRSVAAVIIYSSLFAAFAMTSRWVAGFEIWIAVLSVPVGAFLAVAATISPVYGASQLCGVRMPHKNIVATLLTAVATGSLLLGAFAPFSYFLWGLDDEWIGPLSIVAVFAISALASGIRLHGLMLAYAERNIRAQMKDDDAKLSPNDKRRVGQFARITLMFLILTSSLSGWAWFGV